MNIEAYRPLIDQLVPLLKEPDFDELFGRFIKKEPKQIQFLVKMELKRLAEPCIRLIDCRPRAGDDCEMVRAGTVTHYLDGHTREIYDKELKLYGLYCMGVYEAVMAKEKALKTAAKQGVVLSDKASEKDSNPEIAASKYNVPLIKLGYHIQRKTERLILSAKVKVTLPGNRLLDASISDFSIHGLKIRLPAHLHLSPKATMAIDLSFMRQAKEQSPGHWTGHYQLIAIHKQNSMYQWVRLVRIDNDDILTERIERYFDKQRPRLTIDTDSAVESVQARGFEDAYFRQLSGAPILIGQTSAGLKPINSLRTHANQNVFNYWRGSDGKLRLSDMLTVPRLRELSTNAKKGCTTLLYCFSHLAGGQLNYFVASNDELKQSGLRNLFFSVGSHRDSWRVFSLTIHALNIDDANRPLSLPDSIQKELGLNRPLSRETQKKLESLKGVVMMFDTTSRMGSHSYKALYSSEDQDANKLKSFLIGNSNTLIKEECFEFSHKRSEKRYLYRTPATARITQRATTGTTVNMSGKGLQVQLNKPLPVAEGDLVMVSLPKLQALDSKIKLMDIPYRVMAMNQSQSLLSLRIHGDTVHPSVVPFMKQLLKVNGHKLKQASEEASLPEYISGLRNMLVTTLPHPAIFISRVENRVALTHVGSGNEDNGLLPFLQQLHKQTGDTEDHSVNLTGLLRGERFNQLLLRPLRVLQEGQPGCYSECLIAASRDEQDNITKVDCLYLMDNTDPEQARAFVETALDKDDFFALRINLSRYGNPSFTSMNKELHYISDYAAHKAQKLEKEFYAILGVGELVDITEEVLVRLAIHQTLKQESMENA